MADEQENVPREIPPVTKEQEKRWAEAGASQKEDKLKQGRADDGTYIIVETDQSTGMQTVVCAPHDNFEILRLAHPQLARNYIEEWGEAGFGYGIFKIVDGLNGTHSAEDIKKRREAADKPAGG